MFDLSLIVLGIVLVILGLGFFLLALLLLRLMPRLQSVDRLPPPPPASLNIASHNEAVLIIKSGGRVSYLNQQARELFNVWEEEPNLESLARRTRPPELFLTLCASEGQSRFSINGRFVEGTSYFAPGGVETSADHRSALLVTLRRPQLVLETTSPLASSGGEHNGQEQQSLVQPGISDQAFNTFTELTQAMASSLDLGATLQAILESIERLLPSDFLEISIWEPEDQRLDPYRLVGIAGVDRHLEKAPERYQADQGYSGYLITQLQPLLVKDVNSFRQVRPSQDRQKFPFLSYLGIPLLLAGELVGTLELASLAKDNFNENDLEVLRLLSGQAAIALNNALLYRQELHRSMELAGLARLAQTVSAIRDPQDLYTQLIESISPLLPVDILGFLVYDENRGLLEGQTPFMGIHADVIEWCRTTIQPDSPAEEIWRKAETIVATNAPEDPRLMALELHHLALAAGIRHTVLAPLTSGGRMLGYLQVADKRDGTPFDQNDLRFLAIIAGQAAPIIENANLVQQSRQRAQRAETLRRIASLTSSSATLDEILKFSILDLARLLQADVAVLFLLDDSWGELRMHRASLFGVSPEIANQLGRLTTDDPQFPSSATGSKQPFLSGDLSEAEEVPLLLLPLVENMKVLSVIDSPLIIRERGIGELVIGSLRHNFYSHGDAQTVATSVSQLASAIEQSSLYAQTDESLRQRVAQLTALTRISRELNTTLQLEPLLERVYDEALRTTRSDCGSILLFDLEETELDDAWPSVPTKGNGSGPRIILHFGDALDEALHPLELRLLESGEPIIINEFKPPHSPAHAGIHSAMLVPIAFQGQVAGLIHLHSKAPGHFGEPEKEIGEALAIQASIALGNAHRYQEQKNRSEILNQRVETLSKLFEVSQVLQTEQPLEQALEAIAFAIQSATQFDSVLISVYDEETNQLERVTGAGIPISVLDELRAISQPWNSIQSLLKPEFRLGRSYFIPYEQSSAIPADVHRHRLDDSKSQMEQSNNWHAEDIFFVPLFGTHGEPLGLISVDRPRNNLRPERADIETLEIFSSQAGLIIESQLRMRQLRSQVGKITKELEIAKEAAFKAQDHLPALLQKDLEQTLAISQLNQRAQRINAGLDIAEMISQQSSRANVLSTLGKETLARMDFDIVLVAEPLSGGLNLTHTFGPISPETNPKALLGQRNPLRQSLQTGDILLVSNLDDSLDWQNTPLLRALEASSFVCLPICAVYNGGMETSAPTPEQEGGGENETLAALLAISRTPLAPFNDDDEQLFNLLSQQVSIALQNLSLLEQTTRRLREVNLLMDYSRQLGSLDPISILRTLIESALHAVPAAETAMVALWDTQNSLLTPREASGYVDDRALLEVQYHPGEGVPGQAFEQRRAMLLGEVDFTRHYNLSPENLKRYRDATGGHLPVSSLAVPIMAGAFPRDHTANPQDIEAGDSAAARAGEARTNPLGVLSLDNTLTTFAFSDDDLAVITSLVQQTALTLENARLYQASAHRSGQLQALTDVSTTITSSLQPEELTATLLDQLQAILPYDTGILWLRERDEFARFGQGGTDRMVVRAAQGFADSDERIGLSVDVQDSQLLNEMINTGHPIWVPNVMKDPRFQAFSLEEELDEGGNGSPGTSTVFERLSWLGVPLIASGEVIGVIALEKIEPNFYSPDDIQVATAFAGQAATGLENAQLYQESVRRAMAMDERSQRLAILNRLSRELSESLDTAHILNFAARELAQIMPCTYVSALLVEVDTDDYGYLDYGDESRLDIGELILYAEYPYADLMSHSPFMPGSMLPNTSIFDRLRESQGIFNTDDVTQETELAPLSEFLAHHNTQSLLIVPIISGGTPDSEVIPEHQFHGLLLVHDEQPHRFDVDEVELARTISNQVAIALQNARLFQATRGLTEDLEIRVQQRTAELAREHQRSETLLRIITELSASLDLDQVLHRTLEVLNEFVDAEQITMLIARPGDRKLYRIASIGYTPEPPAQGAPTPLNTDQGLAGWIITQRQSALIDDVLEDERWVKINYGDEDSSPYQHRSAMGVPLMSGAEALGCLLLFHTKVGHFSLDQLDLVQAAANQVAVAVNNAELYRLIRDQAEDLGNMLRSQQIETSRSKAILEAVADGVLVTDAKRQISLFNESAEKILGLSRSEVLGKSMEQFSGLFGRAARRWMETVTTWSKDPTTYQPGELFAEQLTLEDGRVILVHLAPVSLRNDFLGTVSIFQDITHQVEVDRLKSEFVATVSHELRTPMTSIKGYVEILLMGAAGPLATQQESFLQIVKVNADRLAVLVNDLLDISQIEAGRVVLTMQPVNLDEVADQAIEDLMHLSDKEGKPVIIEKEIQVNLPRVKGDPERLRHVFENLLDNAYQYNTANGRIIVAMHKEGNDLQVDITDTGAGIHPHDQERIFERFYRGDNTLTLGISGTGLGLSIAKNLVEMHNGRIWFTSKGIPGEGSTFSFTIPIYNNQKNSG
jgi:PAS domain S-box-containing protein